MTRSVLVIALLLPALLLTACDKSKTITGGASSFAHSSISSALPLPDDLDAAQSSSIMKQNAAKTSVDGSVPSPGTSKGTSASAKDMAAVRAMYHSNLADFSEGVLRDSKAKVLFFYASWCPVCQRADKDLQALFSTETFGIPLYKVNFDTEKTLRAKYGVTYQHTFVLVDGEGNMISKIETPDLEKIKTLLRGQ